MSALKDFYEEKTKGALWNVTRYKYYSIDYMDYKERVKMLK